MTSHPLWTLHLWCYQDTLTTIPSRDGDGVTFIRERYSPGAGMQRSRESGSDRMSGIARGRAINFPLDSRQLTRVRVRGVRVQTTIERQQGRHSNLTTYRVDPSRRKCCSLV